jgi:hypothetical protein
MLRGIKQRAEALTDAPRQDAARWRDSIPALRTPA